MFFELCGIICTNSNPVIRHCRISDNTARSSSYTYAAGITLNNSNPEIAWCNIINNVGGNYAGGIYLINSSPVITGCNISGNAVFQYGGGIYILGNSNPIITNCNIENNTSNMYGGGIAVLGGAVTISECTVGYNHAETGGGGISIHSGSVFLDHCIIEHNNCLYPALYGKGGGIFTSGGVLTVDHCTFCGNEVSISNPYGMEIHTEGNAAMTVTNSIFLSIWDFWTIVFNSTVLASVSYDDFKSEVVGSGTVRFIGNVPPGLGVLTQVNTNGDTCDVYYNIYLDPLFANLASHDYHLTWANWPTPDSTKSPCIDAGDPLSPFDPDGTITDMGVFSFDQSIPVELVSFTAELNENSVMLKWVTATETNNRGFEIQRKPDKADWEKVGFVEGHGTTTEPNSYSFEDKNISTGIYLYRLKQIDYNGSFEYSSEVKVEVGSPLEFSLEQNYPNPFNPSTSIQYQVSSISFVSLVVYDILGNEIETLVNEEKLAGTYEVEFNSHSGNVQNLPSGVYFYQLRILGPEMSSGQTFTQTKKMLLLK
jgi:parallel beta-helix repeat protein